MFTVLGTDWLLLLRTEMKKTVDVYLCGRAKIVSIVLLKHVQVYLVSELLK